MLKAVQRVMSKLNKPKGKQSIPLTTSEIIPTGPIRARLDKGDCVQLNLHVKPGAKVTKVAEITETYIGLQVKQIKECKIFINLFRYLRLRETVKPMKKLSDTLQK